MGSAHGTFHNFGVTIRCVQLRPNRGSALRYKFFCCFVSAVLFGWPVSAIGQQLPSSPDRLMSQVVANELQAANAPGHCMYRIHNVSRNGSTTREVIEARDWIIGRLIRRNGKPLTTVQRREEEKRLARLLTDPQALQNEQAKQQVDEQRVRDLFKSLPQAFYYEYVESQSAVGAGLVLLEFHPNRSFHPPTRELRVLTGMQGTILVDVVANRIVRVRARLVKRVNFAWGFLGHLDPGGTFRLERENVGYGRWETTKIAMHFTGKVFLFKTLRINSVRTASDFRPSPNNLTLRDGLDVLKAWEDDR